jgi:hypothetical protein
MLFGSQIAFKIYEHQTSLFKTPFLARDLTSAGFGRFPARGEALSELKSLMIETFSEVLS